MPGSREEDFKRNNALSLYGLNGHTLTQEPLTLGTWNLKFYGPPEGGGGSKGSYARVWQYKSKNENASSSLSYKGIHQTNYVNSNDDHDPGTGSMCKGLVISLKSCNVFSSTLSIHRTLIAIVFREHNAVFLCHCWFLFIQWWDSWYANISTSEKSV